MNMKKENLYKTISVKTEDWKVFKREAFNMEISLVDLFSEIAKRISKKEKGK
jgi:hypothetical protein